MRSYHQERGETKKHEGLSFLHHGATEGTEFRSGFGEVGRFDDQSVEPRFGYWRGLLIFRGTTDGRGFSQMAVVVLPPER